MSEEIKTIDTVEQLRMLEGFELHKEQDYYIALSVHNQELLGNTMFMIGLGVLIGMGLSAFTIMFVRML